MFCKKYYNILKHSFEFKFFLDFKKIIFNMNFTFIAKKLSHKKNFKDLPNEEIVRKKSIKTVLKTKVIDEKFCTFLV
jgi:hypothetical protein